jgi:leader peptidase (prepilin peptidase) / N-methyltransferase
VNAAAAAFVLAPALALGSFLNVVAVRVPERRSIVRPPSSCGSCGNEIAWRDNIPVVSWLLLRGRCRHCSTPISAVYPLVEATTAVLVTLSAIDARLRIVPNRIVVPAAAIVLVAHTAIDPSVEWALGALGASGFLFLAALAYPKGLGLGDVKLAVLMGAMLGATVSVALMLGFIAALVPSLVLLARHGSAARKMGIPLVPFLALGSLVALFAGERLLDGYLSLF